MRIMDVIFIGILFLMTILVNYNGQQTLAYGLQQTYKRLVSMEKSCYKEE